MDADFFEDAAEKTPRISVFSVHLRPILKTVGWLEDNQEWIELQNEDL